MRNRVLMGLTALAWLVISPAALADDEIGSHDIFRLCNSVEKIRLVVEDVPSDAIEIGLTSERIENVAESRLRAARIYDPEGADFLHIQSNAIVPKYVSGEQIGDGQTIAVSYDLGFNKIIFDSDVKEFGFAETWSQGSILMADANFTVQAISEAVDRFINEFLRVNESKECQKAIGKESE